MTSIEELEWWCWQDVSSVLSNNLSLGYDDHTKNNSVAVVYGEGDTQRYHTAAEEFDPQYIWLKS
ncbi:hypothetical protein NECAME_17450 [Necator americanus]|uniref:Uncharacterized protein n=1 Tax=Necator americanus TaxID=51031 RepID=W2TP96_NECAM|nr:hypothetical protein NECAME_17450 [Necator americanus]ETN83514.1 hypothetical protein NECAME_17450 [Necator americanus]